jgi:hypothetical protein
MRKPLDKLGLQRLLDVIGKTAPGREEYSVYLTGGATAVERGWRNSTLDADLSANRDSVFSNIQQIKEDLNLNIEFAKPSDFVPKLPGEKNRHIFIKSTGNVHFYHYDPYSQAFSKIVRGFERDLKDVQHMVSSGLVDLIILMQLVTNLPDSAFKKYPQLNKNSVVTAVQKFVEQNRSNLAS